MRKPRTPNTGEGGIDFGDGDAYPEDPQHLHDMIAKSKLQEWQKRTRARVIEILDLLQKKKDVQRLFGSISDPGTAKLFKQENNAMQKELETIFLCIGIKHGDLGKYMEIFERYHHGPRSMEETIGQILAQIQIDTLAEWEREVVKEFLQRGHSPRETLQLLGYKLLP